MTKRDNLICLLRRQGYDEIPFDFFLCPGLEEEYKRQTGGELSYNDYFGFPARNLPKLMESDTDTSRFHKYHDRIDANTYIDSWGVGHRSSPTSMHMSQILYPLRNANSVEEIQAYPLPEFRSEENGELARQTHEIHQKGLAAVGNTPCTIWEAAWYIRGMENLMTDMLLNEDMAAALFDRIEAGAIARAELYARAGVDILYLGDDIGMQHTIMMSRALYRQWLKPRLIHVIESARRLKPDIIIFYHSCGFVEPFIPDLIEAGIDVLNPVQPECMDFAKIHEQYGDVLSFHGVIGTQTTMPFGSTEDVKQAVQAALKIAGAKGGLFIAPTHMLEPEVPWKNILAFVEECQNFKI